MDTNANELVNQLINDHTGSDHGWLNWLVT